MNIFKTRLFLVLSIIGIAFVNAQQDPQYTQYMLNGIVINPAIAGSRGVSTISGLHRSQWIGLEGAPTTQTLNFNAPVSRRVGIGLSVVNDAIGNGTQQETYFDAVFSYNIPVSEEGNLAFGINAGGDWLSVDFTKLVNYGVETNLPNIDRKFSPTVGLGTYFYTEQYFIGLSVPSLLETEHFDNSGDSNSYIAKERMNFYLMSGAVFDLNRNTKLRPAILIKAVSGAPVQVDLTASFLFNDRFSVGAAYRLDAAFSALFGMQITNEFLAGLAYDIETTELGSTQFNDGSFEVFLRYDFLNRFRKKATYNFF
jgi:type IX secretion system PorP/SprF family membrane protein